MQITPGNLQALYQNYSTLYQNAYLEPETFYQDFSTTIPSGTSEEVLVWMDVLPQAREWLGDRYVNNALGRSYRLKNKLFEGTVGLNRSQIEDDKYGVFAPTIQMLARSAKKWPDQQIANAIQAGTTALGFDGVPFFSGAHPQDMSNPNSPTYRNLYDASVSGGAVGTPLNAQNLMMVVQNMMSVRGADNAPLGVKPTHLVVPSQLWGIARQVCELQYIAQAVGSNVAAMQESTTQGWVKPIRNPYLDSNPTRWYVIAADEAVRPFVWILRNAPEMTFLNRPDDANVFLQDQFLFGYRSRGVAGYSLPFLAASASA